MTITENNCSSQDTVYSILILNQDDEVLDFTIATECNAQWMCENFHAFGLYLEHERLTWKRWVAPVEPEDPPVDPEPEPPVQSGN